MSLVYKGCCKHPKTGAGLWIHTRIARHWSGGPGRIRTVDSAVQAQYFPNYTTGPCLVLRVWFEQTTYALQVRCSTRWAKVAWTVFFLSDNRKPQPAGGRTLISFNVALPKGLRVKLLKSRIQFFHPKDTGNFASLKGLGAIWIGSGSRDWTYGQSVNSRLLYHWAIPEGISAWPTENESHPRVNPWNW